MNWAFSQVFQKENDYECRALSGELMTRSSEAPVPFHNCIIWKWLRTTLFQQFLIMGQRKTAHLFLQPIFLECAHMKHVILNQLSSWVLTPLSFCQHTLPFVGIQRQLHFLNSTTNRGKKKSPESEKLALPFTKQLEGVSELLSHSAQSVSRCTAQEQKSWEVSRCFLALLQPGAQNYWLHSSLWGNHQVCLPV